MKRLGIDIGASSCQFVLLDENNTVLWKKSFLHHNKVKDNILTTLGEIPGLAKDESVLLSVCGTMSHLTGLSPEYTASESLALSQAVCEYYPGIGSCIMIGAQNTLYMEPEDGKEPKIRRNSNCSAGTGSFFEEQAGRLGIKLEDISTLIEKAKSIPHIAGRCSVFSKTDMIHHMQEGTPTEDLLLGLCYSLVRNYKANILQNRDVKKPVLLLGGVMKNTGVIRAIKDQFSLSDSDLILDENSDYMPAIGCALMASQSTTAEKLQNAVQSASSASEKTGLKPLYLFRDEKDAFDYRTEKIKPGKTWLGVDIGSTSINLVLINEKKEVLYYSYVKNLGKPLELVQAEIEKMKSLLPDGVEIEKIAVTGSGRERVGKAIGAGLIINEITAQTEGAVLFHPETETIFEIGGQDSKYMSLKNGKMADFEMNKVCAAGTGAFLEEQIKKLGISMQEFLDLALKSENPCALGDRCTVFIESSITKALANGSKMEDVCAGLAYAIVNNYLNRVINLKPIGDKVAIQGGIAYNEAVICAFRALTGKEIHVSPWFSVTGALGAASLCTNTRYLTFDKEKNQALNRKLNEDTEKSYLGDYKEPDGSKPVIGIPRVVFLHKMFPLFRTLFTQLGFDVLLSPLTTQEIVRLSQKYSVAETCYPIKLINGHIAWLLDHGANYIFLPRLYTIKHKGSKARKDYSCMYMQTSPLLMEQAFHFEERGVKLLMPELSLNFGKKFMINSLLSLAPQLGKHKPQMLPALMKGMKVLFAYSDKLETLATDFLDTDEPVFVLVSRVYNIIDPVLNMGIEEELNRMGCRVIHLEHLQASVMHVHTEYENLCWPFGQHQLTGMEIIKQHKNLYPVYITNHGCGPDTALQHYIEKTMEGREYLHLEVDEHSSKVGIITRLEAFLYSLNQNGVNEPITSSCSPDACNSCAHAEEHGRSSAAVLPDADKNDTAYLIPDFGIYTELLRREVPDGFEVITASPLKQHRSFNYAINKEYYSLLVTLEELLNMAEAGKKYRLLFPTDEGSEVFSQYGRLIQQELTRKGSPTELASPFLEDILSRADYKELFVQMNILELSQITDKQPELDGDLDQLISRMSDLAKEARHLLAAGHMKKVLVIGEPLCVYKNAVMNRCRVLAKETHMIPMPLSEALLFHLQDTDQEGKSRIQLAELKKIHDMVSELLGTESFYTGMDKLFASASGKLDFCVGDMARYRFAKLLSASAPAFDGVFMIQSNEENAGIINKTLADEYDDAIELPLAIANLDFEHGLNDEEAQSFIHYL